jgi:hypothetical protein
VEATFFTIYQTKSAIELRPGCIDTYPDARLICTCKTYEMAQETAQSIAMTRQVPLVNHVESN